MRHLKVLAVPAIMLFMLSACNVWQEAKFEVNVKNNTSNDLVLIFNGNADDMVSPPQSITRYTPRVIVEDRNSYSYGYGPVQPECTEMQVTAQNTKTHALSRSISLRLCQDEAGFVEFSSSDFR